MNQLRIIGGQWRGRKLPFPPLAGLRPTPDRLRETLFNWLMPFIEGSRGLDGFAGSGALGIEALSRGAKTVTFVEQHPQASLQLQQNLDRLQAQGVVIRGDFLDYLQQPPTPFDIVWLDPPFRQNYLSDCLARLDAGWLVSNACVYVESERNFSPTLPENWRVYREKYAGQIAYRLLIAR